jgi:hypothetical protein
MIDVIYPTHNYRIKGEKGKEVIFDESRKIWVRLTPEEWIRQNFLQYLIQVMQYPKSLIAVEKEIYLGELKKRFDLMVYSPDHEPWMIVECKAAFVPLNGIVLEQVLRYNMSVPVPFLFVTNGNLTAGFERKDGSMLQLKALPAYPENQ